MSKKQIKDDKSRLNKDNIIDVRLLNEKIMSEPGPNRVHYLEDLVSKQLDLYNWCEEKVSTLATMDSILLGAATLLVERFMSVGADTTWLNKTLNITMIVLVILPVLVSLAISLWHIRPKMGKLSNKGNPNHRSSNGIRHYNTLEAYKNRVLTINDDEICNDLIKQIYGMNKNIWKNQRSIKIAVACDLIGLVGFLLMIVFLVTM